MVCGEKLGNGGFWLATLVLYWNKWVIIFFLKIKKKLIVLMSMCVRLCVCDGSKAKEGDLYSFIFSGLKSSIDTVVWFGLVWFDLVGYIVWQFRLHGLARPFQINNTMSHRPPAPAMRTLSMSRLEIRKKIACFFLLWAFTTYSLCYGSQWHVLRSSLGDPSAAPFRWEHMFPEWFHTFASESSISQAMPS